MSVQWPLVFFTLFIALGAGTLGVTGVLAAMGKDKEIRMPAIVTSIVSVAIGGCASVFHLQHFDRIFNGFGHLSSGITQELIFIVVTVLVIVVYFVFARKGGDTPKWVGVLAIVAAVLLVFFMSHSYGMAARPAWNTPMLYAFYLCGAFLFGSAAALALLGWKGGDTAFAAKLLLIAGVLQTVVVVAYGIVISTLGGAYSAIDYYFDSTTPTRAMQDASASMVGFLLGENALLFWGGAVLVGTVAPLILGFLATKKAKEQALALGGLAAVCALLGGIAFRVILYNIGYAAYLFF